MDVHRLRRGRGLVARHHWAERERRRLAVCGEHGCVERAQRARRCCQGRTPRLRQGARSGAARAPKTNARARAVAFVLALSGRERRGGAGGARKAPTSAATNSRRRPARASRCSPTRCRHHIQYMSEPEPPEENVIEIRGLPQSPSGRLASEPAMRRRRPSRSSPQNSHTLSAATGRTTSSRRCRSSRTTANQCLAR